MLPIISHSVLSTVQEEVFVDKELASQCIMFFALLHLFRHHAFRLVKAATLYSPRPNLYLLFAEGGMLANFVVHA